MQHKQEQQEPRPQAVQGDQTWHDSDASGLVDNASPSPSQEGQSSSSFQVRLVGWGAKAAGGPPAAGGVEAGGRVTPAGDPRRDLARDGDRREGAPAAARPAATSASAAQAGGDEAVVRDAAGGGVPGRRAVSIPSVWERLPAARPAEPAALVVVELSDLVRYPAAGAPALLAAVARLSAEIRRARALVAGLRIEDGAAPPAAPDAGEGA